MKKIAAGLFALFALTAPAMSADIYHGSTKDTPDYAAASAPSRSWTGFYIGVEAGGGFGIFNATSDITRDYGSFHYETEERPHVKATTDGAFRVDDPAFIRDHQSKKLDLGYDGFFGGLNAEYLIQRERVVFGLVGQFDIGSLKGSATDSRTIGIPAGAFGEESPAFGLYDERSSLAVEQKWNGDLLLKLGVLATPDTLLFIEGGPSWARFNVKGSTTATLLPGLEGIPELPGASFSEDETRLGLKIGVGISSRLDDRLIGSLVADYADYGTTKAGSKGQTDLTSDNCGGITSTVNHGVDADLSGWSVKGRLSYQLSQ